MAGVVASAAAPASAGEAWITSGAVQPIEQRVAVAVGPSRTTLWTSLRFDATAGRTAIIVPAPPGSALDLSSDAWFEALEAATAPRIFPPAGADPFCPGKSGSDNLFEIDGQLSHTASLSPLGLAVLDSVPKLSAWVAQQGVTLPQDTASTLSLLGDVRFVTLVFETPAGKWLTPTVRVSMPGAPPRLPLALVKAAGSELAVTVWTLGAGRADLGGATEVTLAPSALAWDAQAGASNHGELVEAALAADPTRFLVESSSHAALSDTTSIAAGTATIDSVVATFFERAAAYGDGNFDAAACLAAAEPALAASTKVAAACPHAGLGVIDPATPCDEMPAAGEIDPASLRCGLGADDLAVALSALTPKDAVLTRARLVIPSQSSGLDWPIELAPGASMSPVLECSSVDYGACGDGGTSSSSSSSSSSSGHGSSSSSSGSASSSGIIFTGEDPDTGASVDIDLGEVFDAVPDGACSCSGPDTSASIDYTTDTESCSTDTASSTDTCSGDTSAGDSCSSGSGDTESCSSGSGGDSCSSGSGGDSCSSGGGGDSCSGGGGSGCSGGGDAFKCTTAGGHKPRGPRFSILLVAALAVLAPLRRLGRKRRDEARNKLRR